MKCIINLRETIIWNYRKEIKLILNKEACFIDFVFDLIDFFFDLIDFVFDLIDFFFDLIDFVFDLIDFMKQEISL